MDFAIYDLIITILMLLLIGYISLYSQINKDIKLRAPFWVMIILMMAVSTWMKWDNPYLRLTIMAVIGIGILSIYYLSFRKRIKTRLDYLKLIWIILFFVDVLTINLMRSLILKGFDNVFVNPKLVLRLDNLFDIFMLLFTIVIAGIIYRNEIKKK